MSSESASQLSVATANFALNLLRRAGAPTDDVILSPVSIAVALAMTYAGADGNTAKQMNDVMFGGMKDAEVHKGFQGIVSALNNPNASYKLHTANRIYSMQGYALLDEFLKTVTENYKSQVLAVDFEKEAEKTRLQINDWVAETTQQKIKDLIPQGVLDAMTRLVLVNAIYFKGTWKKQFEEEQTRKEPFYSAPGKELQVDMMCQNDKFMYNEEEDVQVLGMPYVSDDLAMFILLPKERYGLAALEKSMTGERFLKLVTGSYPTKVIVELPRFRLEKSFSLKEALGKLGMIDMFDDEKADFTKMTGNRDLKVSAVIHKAFIEVNEEGSTAAAATAVVAVAMCAIISTQPPPVVKADHPFLFAIVDQKSEAILFIGHIKF